ncbi:DUF3829 domain-containing protein [Aureimonas sp. AU20]|uniref:DUF3829 domain-containing protein n=1 Tax=Aureimonas sp. AU20 TaxID=1349819 RepID=UPI00072225C8|nr:DUF3829 domain-containing protein [Aureimonas sp. AU20]ALN75014.1 hypothetical protein M673_20000 [Aureimonas sp. AU20]
MRHRDRAQMLGFALLAAACLAGCNGEGKDGAAKGTATQSLSSAEQAELAKSNAYITAANESSGAFGNALATYRDTVSPKLSGNRPLETYAVVPVQLVTKIRTRLETAGAMQGSIPELDPAARDYAAAIAAFEPVNNGLSNYAQSKGFLTDGGAKARAEDPAFVASLAKVADAETVFYDKIEARDERLMREAYDKAPEGSVERYRAGIVLRGKAAMKEALTVFTDPADVATRQAFAKNLDEMAGMVENWDRVVRAEKPEGCPALQGSFNSVIADGRKAVQSAGEGRFDPNSGTPSFILQQDYSRLQQNFSMMILQLNQPFSC